MPSKRLPRNCSKCTISESSLMRSHGLLSMEGETLSADIA